jgi:hypothetical protein
VTFAATAFFFFLVADGTSLFDPLMYVKARWATYHDDYSPYLHWGDQFLVILKGTGWLMAPLAAAGALAAFRRPAPPALKSVAVLALGWLVVFCTTRQLRGYWMLPAVPLFYVLAAWYIGQLRRPRLRVVIAAAALVLMIGQTVSLSWRVRHTDLNELRSWVVANVAPHESLYLLGDSVLRLPRNTGAMGVYRTAYERELASDITAGRPFVERHMKNWEEIATLRLFDMLDYRNDRGYTLFHYRDMPPQKFPDLVRLDRMDYLIVQEHFAFDEVPGLSRLLADGFHLIGTRRSEGGDGSGLLHSVYRRVRP